MLTALFFLALFASLLAGVFLYNYYDYERRAYWQWIGAIIAWFSGGLLVVTGFVMTLTIPTSIENNAKLVAFSEANQVVFRQTAQVTQDMTVGAGRDIPDNVLIESPYWEQAKVASERWKELRDQVVAYNNRLRAKQRYWNHWFLRMWIVEPPADLKPIVWQN